MAQKESFPMVRGPTWDPWPLKAIPIGIHTLRNRLTTRQSFVIWLQIDDPVHRSDKTPQQLFPNREGYLPYIP
jgi:hypothetical protein